MTNDKIAACGTPQPRDLLRITGCSVYTRDRAGRKQTRLVKNVSFQVSPGECLAIVGNSGAGKSLLVKASLGILPTELLAEFGGGKRHYRMPMQAHGISSWGISARDTRYGIRDMERAAPACACPCMPFLYMHA